jgi:hypothetical protein
LCAEQIVLKVKTLKGLSVYKVLVLDTCLFGAAKAVLDIIKRIRAMA